MASIEVTRGGDGLVSVALNRPEKMNAIDLATWRALGETFAALENDGAVRCVILRGAGTQAFAPGADISEFESLRADAGQAAAYDRIMRAALAAVAECRHPTIAQIYGPCVGAGLELAAQCDLRIAGRSARFGVPVGRISVVMGQPEIAALMRLAGPAAALEILLEARVFPAEEAKALGLLNRVVDDEAVEKEVQETARRIAANAPLVNRWHKQFVRRLQSAVPLSDDDLAQAYDFLVTDDYREGMAAFAAKRKPVFQGR